MSNYNSQLQLNNETLSLNNLDLQSLIDQANALPDAGGVELPALTNEGIADDLVTGKELIDSEGNIVTGTNPYEKVATDTEVNTQADLIAQIKSTVDNLPEAGSGGSSNIIDTCNITINSFNTIHHLSYTAYENNIVVTKCLSGNIIDLTNIICGSAISFFNSYDFNGFVHSHDSQFIQQTARNIYTLSAPTEPNVNATIQIFDDD